MNFKRWLKSVPYSQRIAPYVFISPFIIIFLLFFVYPAISTVIMSFQEVVPGHVTFVGLENFRNLFNADFYKAVSNSLIYTVITIAVLIPLPLVLSVLLDSKKWLERTFSAQYFLPALVSVVVGGFTFRLILVKCLLHY